MKSSASILEKLMNIFISIQFKTLPLEIINQFAGLLTDAPAHGGLYSSVVSLMPL